MTTQPSQEAAGPSLAVAIPSFEQGPFVANAIESLRTLVIPFEAIIQDGGSSEETLTILRQAIDGDPRISLVVEPDGGQSDAINRAWSRLVARHRYATWFNTDDVMRPEGVAELVAFLDRSPTVVAAYGDLDVIDEHGTRVGSVRAPDRVSRSRLVHHHNLVPGICPVLRSSALAEVGFFDVNLHFAMDHDLFIRLASVGKLRRAPVTVAEYRVHSDGKTWRDKPASDAEAHAVRERHRKIPRPLAEALRLGYRLTWWPQRRAYTTGVMRRAGRSFTSPQA